MFNVGGGGEILLLLQLLSSHMLHFVERNNAVQESISPTFYKRICANILAPIKSLTFTVSTKKLCAKLSYEKAAHKMLVKLTPGLNLIKL
jgi:hypothetical protein